MYEALVGTMVGGHRGDSDTIPVPRECFPNAVQAAPWVWEILGMHG